MIEFGPELFHDLGAAARREWLETNGLGGYASSTTVGMNTRRYHGLLVAAVRPPVARMVLLSRLEETLVLAGRRYDLSTNQYPGSVYPQGYRLLTGFRLDPYPRWTYRVEGLELEKSLFLVHGENTVVIRYRLLGSEARAEQVRLEARPLIAFRDHHALTHENPALNPRFEEEEGRVSVTPYPGLTTLHLAHNAADLDRAGYWYRTCEYLQEQQRGLDFQEDLYSPFSLGFDLSQGGATIVASSWPHRAADAVEMEKAEVRRRSAARSRAPRSDELAGDLAAAADQFLVARGELCTVIAGYHWFTDWGRDTMVSLPGLALVTGRDEAARGILLAFARALDQGMLPNRFPDAGETPEYNTVDATLWFFHAVQKLIRYTRDVAWVQGNLWEALRQVIEWHERGTRYGIHLDEDGLLWAGEPGVQLTWMDAKVGGWVVTPRRGKPVEIQALWYNALAFMACLADRLEDEAGAERYRQMAGRARRSFSRLFWNGAENCLYDVVDGERPDASIRPNQVFAASLPHTMLGRDRVRAMLAVVERELLTPYGLRTLSPRDPRYRGSYGGDPASRDACYHQGTVWPWLLGPFISAYVRAYGETAPVRERARAWLEPFGEHLRDSGLGQVSEIFCGDPPYAPCGCIAQAWSVAELLRALCEDAVCG